MPRLILMRHAKSSWSQAGQRDHQRPLNARGQHDAPAMGRRLLDAGWVPDLALVSDAARTEETWAWMQDRFGQDVPFALVPALYHATPDAMLEVLRRRIGTEETVMILAHNPGLEEAVESWTGEYTELKTANAVLLEHTEPWSTALGRSDWRLDIKLEPPGSDAG